MGRWAHPSGSSLGRGEREGNPRRAVPATRNDVEQPVRVWPTTERASEGHKGVGDNTPGNALQDGASQRAP